LPTEPEWERAARGVTNTIYPWGNYFDENMCNNMSTGYSKVCPIGMYSFGATTEGIQDLVGNAWEWCLSLSMPYPYKSEYNATKNEGNRVIRGGSYKGSAQDLRSTIRREDPPSYSGASITFRLVEEFI
jgi:formylglycine-generating enzyme required for sulfatase activity